VRRAQPNDSFFLGPVRRSPETPRSSNHSLWNRRPFLCHPEEPTCLRQVKGGMNMGKRCLPSRPRGPAPKISPARKGSVHSQAVERRRCGTTLFVCSSGAKPRDLQVRGPFVEASSFRVTQNCHLDRSAAEWRDLRFSSRSHADTSAPEIRFPKQFPRL
jgi:hypothetical protein